MAVYKLFPTKDTTLYSDPEYRFMNTGLDAINEVGNYQSIYASASKVIRTYTYWNTTEALWNSSSLYWNTSSLNAGYYENDGNSVVSRFLIEFDQDQIDTVLSNIVGDKQYDAYFKNYVAKAEQINVESRIEIFPVSNAWENGSGHFEDRPFVTDGASWRKRFDEDGSDQLWSTQSFKPFETASFHPNEPGGATWYTGSNDPNLILPVTHSFNTKFRKDLEAPVTQIVKAWHSSSIGKYPYPSIANNGFVVKWSDATEWYPSPSVNPVIKFFSSDTYTIYPPQLEIRWRDFDYTSSLQEIDTTELVMSLGENPGVFYEDSINRFRINVRERYPRRVYQTGSYYTDNKVLPSSSYYAIKDLDTNEYVVDFDEQYTQISADNNSNYFDVYMNGLEPERNYQILVKTQIGDNVLVSKDKFYFKVVNG